MIRMLLNMLPLVGLGLAAVFVAPSTVPIGGEPILLEAKEIAELQPASFEGPACATPLVDRDETKRRAAKSDLRWVALELRQGRGGLTLALREMAPGDVIGEAALMLLVDASGAIVSVETPAGFACNDIHPKHPESDVVGAI